MDWRIWNLYKDFKYGYIFHRPTRWQRLKTILTGRYYITVSTSEVERSKRTYILTPDHQNEFSEDHIKYQDPNSWVARHHARQT